MNKSKIKLFQFLKKLGAKYNCFIYSFKFLRIFGFPLKGFAKLLLLLFLLLFLLLLLLLILSFQRRSFSVYI